MRTQVVELACALGHRVIAGIEAKRAARASAFRAAIWDEPRCVTPIRERPPFPVVVTSPLLSMVTVYGPCRAVPPNAKGGPCGVPAAAVTCPTAATRPATVALTKSLDIAMLLLR